MAISDPFPHLGRRPMFEDSTPSAVKKVEVLPVPKGVEAAVEVLKGAEKATDALGEGKRKRGRPVAPKPWEDAGISRATWNRRKKAAEK